MDDADPTITYEQVLGYIIDGGIAEVRAEYLEEKDHHKRDGAIEGFEACRGKTPYELVELWRLAGVRSTELMRQDGDLNEYWKARYHEMQIEWTLNVLSIGLGIPLLPHLPTSRAVGRYARILAQHQGVIPPP